MGLPNLKLPFKNVVHEQEGYCSAVVTQNNGGREYLKGSVLDLSVNHEDNRRSGDRFQAIAILTAVAVGTVTEGAVLVAQDAILTAWNWTTAQMRGIVRYASGAVLVIAGVTLVTFLGYHVLRALTLK